MRLIFEDPELEAPRWVNVPDDASAEAQEYSLRLVARRAYEETAVRVDLHRAIAADDGLLRLMVSLYGSRLEPVVPRPVAA